MSRAVRRAPRRAASARIADEAIARENDQEPISPRTSPLNIPKRVLGSSATIAQYVLNVRSVAASLTPHRASQPGPSHAPAAQRVAGRRGRAPVRGLNSKRQRQSSNSQSPTQFGGLAPSDASIDSDSSSESGTEVPAEVDGSMSNEEVEEDEQGEGDAQTKRQRAMLSADAGFTAAERRTLANAKKLSRRDNTTKSYASHQDRFWWWCLHDPTTGRLREKPHSGNLVNSTDELEQATRFMLWVQDHSPGHTWRNKAAMLTVHFLEQCHSAMQDLYAQQLALLDTNQRAQVSVKMLMYNQTYKDGVQTTKSRLAAKGQRAGGQVDPQKCTSEDTLDFQQYVILQKHLQQSGKFEEIRDRSIFAFLYASIGRADEGRMIFLADIIKPRAMKCLGPCPAFLLACVMRGGKTLKNGSVSFTGSICRLITAVCPHGSLGQYLALRFTIMGEPFPNPKRFKRWSMTPMWPGSSAKENLTYQQQHDRINHYLRKELGFYARKVTHIFRVLSARTLDESGVDEHMAVTLEAVRTSKGKNVASFLKALGSTWLAEQRTATDAAV